MNDEEFHRALMGKLGDKASGSIIAGSESDKVIEDPSLSKTIPDAKAIGSEPYVMSPELKERIKELERCRETFDGRKTMKIVNIGGYSYVLWSCDMCAFFDHGRKEYRCKYPKNHSELADKITDWHDGVAEDCPLEDAKEMEITENRWAVIKTLEYATPCGSSENIKKGVNELTLKILTTDNLKPQIKDFMDGKKGSTQQILDAVRVIAIEPKKVGDE